MFTLADKKISFPSLMANSTGNLLLLSPDPPKEMYVPSYYPRKMGLETDIWRSSCPLLCPKAGSMIPDRCFSDLVSLKWVLEDFFISVSS